MTVVVLVLLAAAPAEDARFVMELQGVPVAELHVSLDGNRYLYEALHFFEESPLTRIELERSRGEPEVLALLHRSAAGCRSVVEERSGKTETLCVDTATSGTLDGTPWVARWDAGDVLQNIVVGEARWRRVAAPTPWPEENVFARGLPVPEGALKLEPPVPGSKWLLTAPVGTGNEGDDQRTRCLLLARAAVKEKPGREVVVGLVIDEGRAFPHAWVREGQRSFDPSVQSGAKNDRRYLELPSGALLLRFFTGSIRFVSAKSHK